MAELTIRELTETDWIQYRDIRLASLLDSPDSFGSTHELECSFLPERWKSRLQVSPNMHDAVAYAAISDDSFIGLVSCVIPAAEKQRANIYQMWVSPEHRGKGVGTALLNNIKHWAAVRSVDKLLLSVTTTNRDAISLYESLGFTVVAGTEPLREGSQLQCQSMGIVLSTSGPSW